VPTVLIVDNNFDDRRILTAILEFYGYKVEAALSGTAGMEAARRIRPDLILINAELPDASGLSVTQALRAEPDIGMIPVLCISNIELRNIDPGEYGCNEIIVAPFSPPDLIAAIRRNVAMPNAG
jgi:two-component system, cell cycle response regulator DivK